MSNNLKINVEELRQMIREAVVTRILGEQQVNGGAPQEGASGVAASLFDQHRAALEQERKAIETQLNGTDIKEMAIDTFEKLCNKCGVPSESLGPEAMEVVQKELKRMQDAIQEIANVLYQTATVINAAKETPSASVAK